MPVSSRRRSSIRECGTAGRCRSASARAPPATRRPRRCWCGAAPARAHRRLDFEAGELVALELRSDRHEDAARDRDFVLREHVDAMRGALARLEEEARAVAEIVAVVAAIAGAEDEVVAAGGPVMLRVEVDGVERRRDTGWARGGRCDRSTPGRWWRDSRPRRVQRAEQVAAGEVGLGGARQPGRAGIHVALQRRTAMRPRRIGFDAEARLAEVEIVVRVRAAHQLMRVLEADLRVGAIRAGAAEAAAVPHRIRAEHARAGRRR